MEDAITCDSVNVPCSELVYKAYRTLYGSRFLNIIYPTTLDYTTLQSRNNETPMSILDTDPSNDSGHLSST